MSVRSRQIGWSNESNLLWYILKALEKLGKVIANNSSSTVWGNITGNLSNQTDLQTALNTKENSANKTDNFSIINNTLYPTVQAVNTRIEEGSINVGLVYTTSNEYNLI